MKCLIEPLGKFGDHGKGLNGCLWCDQSEECIKENSNKGDSLLFKRDNLELQFEKWEEVKYEHN